MMVETKIFQFENGIKFFESDITDVQLSRYQELEACYHEPVEEHWFREIFSRIKFENNRVPVFVDIGAALGYYSLLFLKEFPKAKIYAVDPHPHFQDRMRQTFVLNDYSSADYTLIPFAVFPHASTVSFAMRDFGSYIVQGESPNQRKTKNSINVPARKLSDIFSELPPKIDLVKLDIQAAELAVFNHNEHLVDSGIVDHWVVGTHGPKIHDRILSHLRRRHKILYENKAPDNQEDGLIVARYNFQKT